MNDATNLPVPDVEPNGSDLEVTLPEAVMLVLFNPRNGVIAGEGLNLLYLLGGATLTELAVRGHIELDERKRKVRRVGDTPGHPFLQHSWDRIPETPTGIRSLVIHIGTRSRENTLNRLVARGDITKTPRWLFGVIPTHSLEGGHTGTRERLLAPVQAALLEGEEADERTAALVALLSASRSLPSMHADIPWSGTVHSRGKEFERGTGGAKAASDVRLITLAVQIAGAGLAGALGELVRPD